MSHCTSGRRLWGRTITVVDRLVTGLFASEDAFAASQGWQVSRSRLSRTYRDPRFDTRTARVGR